MCVLIFLVAFESFAVTTVMPTVSRALDGAALYAFAFAGPLATGVIGMVVAGSWCDRHGPRAPLSARRRPVRGRARRSPGSRRRWASWCSGAWCRALGGGAMTVALYVIVARLYPAVLHPRVFGGFSAAWVLPSLVGPAAAGAVAQHVGWRWVFLGVAVLVLPVSLVLLPAVRRIGPPSTPASAARRGRLAWATLAAAAVLGLNLAVYVQPAVVGRRRGAHRCDRDRRAPAAGARRQPAGRTRAARGDRDPRPRRRWLLGRRGLPAVPADRPLRLLTHDRRASRSRSRRSPGRHLVAAGPARRAADQPRRDRARRSAPGGRRRRRHDRRGRPPRARRGDRELDRRRRRHGPRSTRGSRCSCWPTRRPAARARTARRCRSRTRSARRSRSRSPVSRSPPWSASAASPDLPFTASLLVALRLRGRSARHRAARPDASDRSRPPTPPRPARCAAERASGRRRPADDLTRGVEDEDGRRHVDAEPFAERGVVGDVEVDVRHTVGRRDGPVHDVPGRPARRAERARELHDRRALAERDAELVGGEPHRRADRSTSAVATRTAGPASSTLPPGSTVTRTVPPGTSTSQTSGAPAPAHGADRERRGARARPARPRLADATLVHPHPHPADERCRPRRGPRPSGTTSSTLVPFGGTGVTSGARREVGRRQLVLVLQREHDVRVADVDAQPGTRVVDARDGHLARRHPSRRPRRRPAGTSDPCPRRTRRRRRRRRAPGRDAPA